MSASCDSCPGMVVTLPASSLGKDTADSAHGRQMSTSSFSHIHPCALTLKEHSGQFQHAVLLLTLPLTYHYLMTQHFLFYFIFSGLSEILAILMEEWFARSHKNILKYSQISSQKALQCCKVPADVASTLSLFSCFSLLCLSLKALPLLRGRAVPRWECYGLWRGIRVLIKHLLLSQTHKSSASQPAIQPSNQPLYCSRLSFFLSIPLSFSPPFFLLLYLALSISHSLSFVCPLSSISHSRLSLPSFVSRLSAPLSLLSLLILPCSPTFCSLLLLSPFFFLLSFTLSLYQGWSGHLA